MINETVIFNCEDELQMKAIAVLIQKASAFRSSIWLHSGDRKANAKSLLGVMSLGIESNSELTITCEGPDEREALESMTAYLRNPDF